jgi:thiamine biosynthesis lipoprotein
VDPTPGGLLVAAGYDRTLAQVRVSTSPVALPVGGPTWRDVEVRESAVKVPSGARLDLGATGKAFAADLVAAQVAETLDTGVIVSVGGDVSVSGTDPTGPGWPVAVTETHPRRPGDDPGQTVALVEGGLATSTVLARTWARGGRTWHHIFDPRTGLPAAVHWRTVTAAGRSAGAANTASTAAVVLGVDAVPWLETHGVAARLVGSDGSVLTCGGWPPDTTLEPRPTRSRKELS